MKKIIALFCIVTLFLTLAVIKAEAQTKVIKKTVKKVVTPQIAPAQPPTIEPTPEADVAEPPPPPPPPPDYEIEVTKEDKGLLGWGLNADIDGKLLFGSILFGARGDIIFSDPLLIGEKVGLAEDAVEYKVGLGLAISDKLKTIPLYADAVVYLKEGSLFGMDPYLGTGLILNLYGTGKVSGGLGGQIYLGILADLGLDSKTGFSLGYGSHQVGSDLSDSGIFFNVAQPLRL